MINPQLVSDYVLNHQSELLEEWLGTDTGTNDFIGWLMCEYPEVGRAKVYKAFFEHKDAEAFHEWAVEHAIEVLENEGHDE